LVEFDGKAKAAIEAAFKPLPMKNCDPHGNQIYLSIHGQIFQQFVLSTADDVYYGHIDYHDYEPLSGYIPIPE